MNKARHRISYAWPPLVPLSGEVERVVHVRNVGDRVHDQPAILDLPLSTARDSDDGRVLQSSDLMRHCGERIGL